MSPGVETSEHPGEGAPVTFSDRPMYRASGLFWAVVAALFVTVPLLIVFLAWLGKGI